MPEADGSLLGFALMDGDWLGIKDGLLDVEGGSLGIKLGFIERLGFALGIRDGSTESDEDLLGIKDGLPDNEGGSLGDKDLLTWFSAWLTARIGGSSHVVVLPTTVEVACGFRCSRARAWRVGRPSTSVVCSHWKGDTSTCIVCWTAGVQSHSFLPIFIRGNEHKALFG